MLITFQTNNYLLITYKNEIILNNKKIKFGTYLLENNIFTFTFNETYSLCYMCKQNNLIFVSEIKR